MDIVVVLIWADAREAAISWMSVFYIVPVLFLVNQEILRWAYGVCLNHSFSHENLKSLVNISGLKHFGTSSYFKTTWGNF